MAAPIIIEVLALKVTYVHEKLAKMKNDYRAIFLEKSTWEEEYVVAVLITA